MVPTQVPCTKNVYKTYKIKKPVTVTERVPRKVHYTDYETRPKTVQYTVMKPVTQMKSVQKRVPVKVTKTGMRKVCKTKKVPKTIVVDICTPERRPYPYPATETRTKTVRVPYTAMVPERKFKTVTVRQPVQKTKIV